MPRNLDVLDPHIERKWIYGDYICATFSSGVRLNPNINNEANHGNNNKAGIKIYRSIVYSRISLWANAVLSIIEGG